MTVYDLTNEMSYDSTSQRWKLFLLTQMKSKNNDNYDFQVLKSSQDKQYREIKC